MWALLTSAGSPLVPVPLCALVVVPSFSLVNLVLPQVGPSPRQAPSSPSVLMQLTLHFSAPVLRTWKWARGGGGFLTPVDWVRSLRLAVSVQTACRPFPSTSLLV